MNLKMFHHGLMSSVGGGGDSDDRIILLLNGVNDTHIPYYSSFSSMIEDDTLPVKGIKVFSSKKANDNKGVLFSGDDVGSCISDIDTGYTLDFWFKGISHNYKVTPYFLSFTSYNEIDAKLYYMSCNYSDNIENFLFTKFFVPSTGRFHLSRGDWHHICVQERTNKDRPSHTETWMFADGNLICHRTDGGKDGLYESISFGMNGSSTDYRIAQVCLRKGIVWTENFAPPTIPYKI